MVADTPTYRDGVEEERQQLMYIVVPYCTFVRYPTVKKLFLFWDKKEAVGIHFILGRIEYFVGSFVALSGGICQVRQAS